MRKPLDTATHDLPQQEFAARGEAGISFFKSRMRGFPAQPGAAVLRLDQIQGLVQQLGSGINTPPVSVQFQQLVVRRVNDCCLVISDANPLLA